MGMTKCKECGNEISTKADACPKCGAKIKRTSLVANLVAIFVAIGVVGAILASYENSKRQDEAAAKAAARRTALSDEQRKQEDAARVTAAKVAAEKKAIADAEWSAVQACQVAVNVSAKWRDPNSVEWPQLSRSFRELKGGVYTVQVEARGKNAFNATVTNVFECKIRATDFAPQSVKKIS